MWLVMVISMNIGIYSKTFDGKCVKLFTRKCKSLVLATMEKLKNCIICNMLPFSSYEHKVSAHTQRSWQRGGKKDSTVHNHSYADSILLRRNNSVIKFCH